MLNKKYQLPIKLKKKDVFFQIVVISFSYLISLIFPYIFKYFLDNVGKFTFESLLLNLALVVLVVFAIHFINYLVSYVEQLYSNRIVKNFQKEVVTKISKINVPDYEKMNKAKILNILNMDIAVLYTYINLRIGFIVDVLKILVISILLLYINPYLACLNFLLIPFYYVGNYFNKNKMENLANIEVEKSDLMMEQIQDVVYKKTSINLFSAWGLFFNKFNSITDSRWSITNKKHKFLLLNMEIPRLISTLTPFVLLVFGIGLVSKNIFTIGTLVMFLQYSQMIYDPITSIANLKASANSSIASFDRVRNFLNYENKDENYKRFFEKISNDIEIKDVEVVNDAGEKLFDIENMTVNENGLYILKGDNGSGKTTLLNIMAGVYSSNQIKDDRGYFKIDKKHFEKISYLYNPSMLFNGTVKENILLENVENMNSCEKMKDLIEVFNAKREDYAVCSAPANLSLGEQQKLFLIRTFLQDRAMIFLDEPSSNLDHETKLILRDYLNEIKKEKIVFLIAHDHLFEEISTGIFEIINKKLEKVK